MMEAWFPIKDSETVADMSIEGRRQIFRPRRGKSKYDTGRVPMTVVMEMDPELRQVGMDLLSLSRAESTWKCSSSAVNGVRRIENDFNIDLSLPWDGRKLLNYIAACKLLNHKSTTVNVNISHIRQHHRMMGWSFEADSVFSRSLLEGMKHSDKSGNKRLAMTPKLMLLLKHRIKNSDLDKYTKLMIWCIATWAWSGSFRCGELLADNVRTFRENDLLCERVRWHSDQKGGYIEVDVLCPKEVRTNRVVTVELLQMNDKMLCPYDAWQKWRKLADSVLELEVGLPTFRFQSGKNMTTKMLNLYLKNLLHEDVDYSQRGEKYTLLLLEV